MIYFDNAATTRIYPEIAEFIKKHSLEQFYNPSGLYFPSVQVFKELNNAREELLNMLNATNSKVLFTASATEANNYALRSFLNKKQKILLSEGEHSSIYQSALYLKEQGFEVEFVKLKQDGTLNLEDLKSKLTENVGLVSVIHASNETGVINDIKTISQIVKSVCPKALVHADGVQAFCKTYVNLSNLGVDLYTLSSHKIHGPRGVGALIYKDNLSPRPLIFGGGQESGIRSGTENTSNILGFVMSAKIMLENLDKNSKHLLELKQSLLENISDLDFEINGDIEHSVPNILSLSFSDVKGEILVHMLEQDEVFVSTGSSCNSKHSGNRILLGMGKNKKQEAGNIRISFCEENTLDEVKQFCNILRKNISKIKELNIWKK